MASRRLSLTISPQASSLLDDLLRSGLWGLTRAAVAREALYMTLRANVEMPKLRVPAAPRRAR